MKKIFNKKFATANVLASIAFCASLAAANTMCVYIFHQPKMPESVRSMRKV